MSKVFNFSAGPAMLPEAVMQKAQQDFLNYNGLGVSIIEMSHRSKEYVAMAEEAVQDLRDLMNLPDNYKVLFMHGGGRGMFANVAMNLADPKGCADYIITGAWSGYAATEGQKYTKVNELKANYVHCSLNETIHRIELFNSLETDNVPLVADASSDILSRPLDITKYGIV